MTQVKICGITSEGDARAAVASGADALGFNFFEGSPRYITPEAAAAITRLLPASIARVGVFVNAAPAEVERIARIAALSTLQFHGDEAPDYCRRWRSWQVIKALRPKDGTLESLVSPFADACDYFLIDRYSPEAFGGTGESLEEQWLNQMSVLSVRERTFLAGGLTPGNVGALVRRIHPYGVDTASGVESAPGKKDVEKMVHFVSAVRAA